MARMLCPNLHYAVDISHISLTIPLNTGIIGGIVTQTPLRLPVDLAFNDFYLRVCARMDLEPSSNPLKLLSATNSWVIAERMLHFAFPRKTS